MSGGIAVGHVENLNINLAKESIRDTNCIYKNGEMWGVVANININEENKTFIIAEIKFEKSISNINDVFDTFEYRNYVLKILKIETLTAIMPPRAEMVSGIIISEITGKE